MALIWSSAPGVRAEEKSGTPAGYSGADIPVSLTLNYEKDGTVLPGVHVSVYRVGKLGADGIPGLDGAFAGYPVDLGSPEKTSQWDLAAQTLAGYAAADHLQPYASAESSDDGRAAFSDLEKGVYLVTADPLKYENSIWRFAPFLLILPQQDTDGDPLYQVNVIPKGIDHSEQPARKEYKVTKHWAGTGGNPHPSSVNIDIYKDGELYDSCTLSEKNGWVCSWSDDGTDESVWQVVERNVADGYHVTSEKTGNTWIITNTFEEEKTVQPDSPQGEKLPQTGQLVWPVPVLAGCGMLLFAVGWRVYKKNEKKKD